MQTQLGRRDGHVVGKRCGGDLMAMDLKTAALGSVTDLKDDEPSRGLLDCDVKASLEAVLDEKQSMIAAELREGGRDATATMPHHDRFDDSLLCVCASAC